MHALDFEFAGLADFYEKSCAGKEGYPSAESAQAHADLMFKGRLRLKRDPMPRQDWKNMTPYGPCRFCHQFHLGHPA